MLGFFYIVSLKNMIAFKNSKIDSAVSMTPLSFDSAVSVTPLSHGTSPYAIIGFH